MVRHFRRKRSMSVFGKFKRAISVKNHYETTLVHGGAGTQTTNVCLTVDDVTNRSTHIQNGGVLKHVVVEIQPQSLAAGKYQCLMFKQLGPVTQADPIAAYFSSTDPLSEDAVLMRRNLMGRLETRRIFSTAVTPIQFTCKWKGNSLMRDGDAINVAIGSNVALTFDIRVWVRYII